MHASIYYICMEIDKATDVLVIQEAINFTASWPRNNKTISSSG